MHMLSGALTMYVIVEPIRGRNCFRDIPSRHLTITFSEPPLYRYSPEKSNDNIQYHSKIRIIINQIPSLEKQTALTGRVCQ